MKTACGLAFDRTGGSGHQRLRLRAVRKGPLRGNDGTRLISVDTAWDTNPYRSMMSGNFAVFPHYIDNLGEYGEARVSLAYRPDGGAEYT